MLDYNCANYQLSDQISKTVKRSVPFISKGHISCTRCVSLLTGADICTQVLIPLSPALIQWNLDNIPVTNLILIPLATKGIYLNQQLSQ